MPDNNVPGFWGQSPWWTRTGYILGLLTILMGAVMTFRLPSHLGPCKLPRNLTRPGLAIELVESWHDVLTIVGPCEAPRCMQGTSISVQLGTSTYTVCLDKVSALASQQAYDRVFIVLYWLLFLYLGVVNFRFVRPRGVIHWIAILVGIAAAIGGTLAALHDWGEDGGILKALGAVTRHDFSAPLWASIRYQAYHKFEWFFLALGCSSPIFFFWPGQANLAGRRRSLFSLLLAWASAVLAVTATFTGLAACKYGHDQRLESAAVTASTTLLLITFTLLTAQSWRGGTLSALDRLAGLPVLHRFTDWLHEDDEPEGPNPAPPAAPPPPPGAPPAVAQ